MTGLRPISPLLLPKGVANSITTEPPQLYWVNPSADLLVDESYQRNLSDRSARLIRKIVAGWNWTRFKPPIVVEDAEGKFHVIDGQHTAIAAASHPGIDRIPVMVVSADKVSDRALAFLGHNRDRINVTPTQMHHTAVAAGEEAALAIDRVCRASGVTILKWAPPGRVFRPGETLAVKTISLLIKQLGEDQAGVVLRTVVASGITPLGAMQIKAVAAVLAAKVGAPDPFDVTSWLRLTGAGPFEIQARQMAASRDLRLHAAAALVLRSGIEAYRSAA